MLVSNHKKPRGFFYLGWVLLNALAVVIAWFITWGIISLATDMLGGTIQIGGQSRITEDFLLLYVLFPSIGLVTGIFQYLLLRRYLPHMAWWIAATLVGWLTPFVTGYFIITIFGQRNDTLSIMLGLLLIGASIVLPQWWMLRKRVRNAAWWILAHGVGWSIAGLFNNVGSSPLPVLLAIAVLPAIATGTVFWLLLDWLPQRELKSSAPG